MCLASNIILYIFLCCGLVLYYNPSSYDIIYVALIIYIIMETDINSVGEAMNKLIYVLNNRIVRTPRDYLNAEIMHYMIKLVIDGIIYHIQTAW